jgi:hypothetical protein
MRLKTEKTDMHVNKFTQKIICDMHINKSTKKSNESKINTKIQNS